MPIIDEYLYSLGAYYDSKSFKDAQKQVSKSLEKNIKEWEKFASEVKLAFQPLLLVLGATTDSLKLIFDLATKVSNQFVGMKSLFVDEDVRNLMAITGVGAVEAQGIRAAEDLTGISIQDLPFATPAQQKMFKEFIETYTTGVNELDPGKLEAFNETTQEFQRTIAESKLKLQLAFMKTIIATGPQLESLFTTLTNTIEDFNDLTDSEAFQTGAKLFVSTIEGIVNVLATPINVAGTIADFFETPNVETNNAGNTNNNITINSNANFQGNPSDNVGIATQYARDNALYISENLGGVIK